MKLKEKLLSLGIFEDNEYLDFYCILIENNKNTKKEKFKTQKHHIIPKCYYRLNNFNINNSKDNLVNLLYKDHIIAHHYLCLCIKSADKLLKYRLDNSFLHLIKADSTNKLKINNFDLAALDNYQKIYEEWKILNSEIQKGKPAWNKGLTKETDERVAKYAKPKHFSKEHNEHSRQSLINYYKTHTNHRKGIHLSEETRRKLSIAKKGKPRKLKNPEMTRKKLSENTTKYWSEHHDKRERLIQYNKTRIISKETHEKMSLNQPNKKEVLQMSVEGVIINKFNSIRQAVINTGIKRWRVDNSCKTGKILKEGFYFKYL